MFVLPELKNPYSAYEPYFDIATMELHHKGHHAKYIENLNKLLVDSELNTERIEDLFDKAETLPQAIRNNAGGHYNHVVFWSILNDTMSTPSMDLMAKITEKYGMMDDFKAEFAKTALSVFGSGWVWLVVTESGELDMVTTKNQDNPIMSDVNSGYPLFGLDMWEHSYYLKFQNRKLEYVNAFWSLLDWDEVSMRYSQKPEMNDLA